jgi:Fe-S-cluster containining protein
MRYLRLAILGDSPCDRCVAACCKQNGHAYAVLLDGDDERRRFAPWSADVPIRPADAAPDAPAAVERVLPYRDDGRCPFLGADDRCTIYDDRPRNCRRFQCVSGYHFGGSHSDFLTRNRRVVEILDSL